MNDKRLKINFIIKLMLIIFFIIFFGKPNEKFSMSAYMLIGSFGLFCYIYLNTKANLYNIIKNQSSKKQSKIRIISSIIFGIITVVGNYQLYMNMNIVKEVIFIIITVLASMTIFQSILIFCDRKISKTQSTYNKPSIKKFFIFFGIISAIYLVFWIGMSYPAQICLDSLTQLDQILGYEEYSNHHPIYQTWLIKIFVDTGLNIFNDINIGIALYVIFQILVMSSIYAYSLITIDSIAKKRITTIIWLLFYCIMPCHIIYSFTIWKDSIFGAIVCLFITSLFRLYKKLGNCKVNYVLLFISTIGIGLFRSNGLPGLIILFILLLIINRQYFKQLLKLLIVPIIKLY